NYGFVMVNPVTVPSVLCANRIPKMPSVDLSLPAPTTSDLLYVATTLPLIAHSTLSPFTDIAISCETGWPLAAALLTAGDASPSGPFILNGAGPNPRTTNIPVPYASQYSNVA